MITEVTPTGPASPSAPLRMERGVITEIPLRVLRMLSNTSPSISRPVGVTSHTTPLSIRRGAGGEASVCSVREKTPQRISKTFFFSQRTQMSRTHRAHRERFALPRPLPFTPPCPAVQTSETLPRSPLSLHATSLPCREKSLHIIKLTTTRQAKIIIYNQAYNPQEIS